MPKVSIILPVYNAEKYLRKCLDSLVRQALSDIEIIVVNDESPDHSAEIIEEYAARDHRIKVINRKNGGLARARNSGLKVATGEYVGFVDCDDWVEMEMFEKMYETGQDRSADIVICDYNRIFEKYIEYSRLGIETEVLDLEVLGMRGYFDKYQFTYKHGDEVWNKIYQRKFLQNYGIIFDTDTFSEDKLFNLSCLLHAKRICTIQEGFYNYLQREGSLMYRKKPDYTKMQMILLEKFYSKMEFYNKQSEFNSIFHELVLQLVENVVYGKMIVEKVGIFQIANDLQSAKKFHFFKQSLRHLMISSSSVKKRVYALLLYFDLWMFFLALKMTVIQIKYAKHPDINQYYGKEAEVGR